MYILYVFLRSPVACVSGAKVINIHIRSVCMCVCDVCVLADKYCKVWPVWLLHSLGPVYRYTL